MKIMGIGGGVGSDNRRVQRPPFLTTNVAEVGPQTRSAEGQNPKQNQPHKEIHGGALTSIAAWRPMAGCGP